MDSSAYEAGKVVGAVIAVVAMIAVPIFFILSLILAIVKKSKGWTVVCVISTLLGLGILGLMGYGAYTAIAGDSSANLNENGEAISADNLLAIKVPKGWRDVTSVVDNEEASLSYGNVLRNEFLIILSEAQTDFEDGTTIRDYADLTAGLMKDALKNPQQSDYEAVSINGMQGLKCTMEGSTEGIKIVYLCHYLQCDSHYHQVLAWTVPSKREAAFKTFKKVCNSIRKVTDTE